MAEIEFHGFLMPKSLGSLKQELGGNDRLGVWGPVSSILAIVLVVIVPVLLVGVVDTFGRFDSATALMQLSVVVYTGCRLARLAERGEPEWFSIVLFGYSYTWLGVTPLLQYFAGQNPLNIPLTEDVAFTQAFVVLLGLVGYDVGWRALSGWQGRENTTDASHYCELPPVRLRAVNLRNVTILAIVTVVLTPFFVQRLGGVSALFASRQARFDTLVSSGYYTAQSKSTGAILTSFASVMPFVSLYALILLLILHKELRRNVAFIVLTCLIVISNLMLNNPISSSRFWFLVVVLSIMFASPWCATKFGVRTVTSLFVAVSLLVFPYLDVFRRSGGVAEDRSVVELILEKTDFDSMVQVGNALSYVNEYGLMYGSNLFGAILFMIPRGIWADKPIDTGSILARYIRYHNENLSAPFWAELYMAFGIIGVVVGFVLLGFMVRGIYRRSQIESRLGLLGVWQFMVPPLALYEVLILRGSLLQAMSRLSVLILVLYLCTRRITVQELHPQEVACMKSESAAN